MPLPPTAALARRLAQARRKLVRDGATPHRAIQGMSSWLGELETLVSVTAYHSVPATSSKVCSSGRNLHRCRHDHDFALGYDPPSELWLYMIDVRNTDSQSRARRAQGRINYLRR